MTPGDGAYAPAAPALQDRCMIAVSGRKVQSGYTFLPETAIFTQLDPNDRAARG
jgi:hypothetical protein